MWKEQSRTRDAHGDPDMDFLHDLKCHENGHEDADEE